MFMPYHPTNIVGSPSGHFLLLLLRLKLTKYKSIKGCNVKKYNEQGYVCKNLDKSYFKSCHKVQVL